MPLRPGVPRTGLCSAAHFLIKSLFNVYNKKEKYKKKKRIENMQAPSAFSLGERKCDSTQKFKTHQWVTGIMMAMSGQKRSTCDHRCLFQDHFKAVTLAHQYSRVCRIAWLFAAENAYELFLTFFSVVERVVRDKLVYRRALHWKMKS